MRNCSIYFSKAQNVRLEMSNKIDEVLKDVDILVSPTTPMKATKISSKTETGTWEGRGKIEMNRNTCPTNLTGHPAMSVPCGFGENGLPIGIQIIGPEYGDLKTIGLAKLLEQEGYKFQSPDSYPD